MAQQTITAFFDSRDDAARAMEALVRAGYSRTAIQLHPETETTYRRTEGTFYDSSRDEVLGEVGFGFALFQRRDRRVNLAPLEK